MRQHLSFREQFRRGNAEEHVDQDEGGAPQGAVFSGGRGRSIASGFFTPMRNRSLPGRHITDCQMRLYMSFRQTETPTVAAAKAGSATHHGDQGAGESGVREVDRDCVVQDAPGAGGR
jgi:hypothetical protein